jgi:hypothetical protein
MSQAAPTVPPPTVLAVPPSSEPLDRQFAVVVQPIRCPRATDESAAVVMERFAGEVIAVVARRVQSDGTWYQEQSQACWERATPGLAARPFATQRRAECFAVTFRRPVPLVADFVSVVAAVGGDVTVSAPPGARCTASGLVVTSGGLRITELPTSQADDRGLVAWSWSDAAAGPGHRRLGVTCTPGGSASIALDAA